MEVEQGVQAANLADEMQYLTRTIDALQLEKPKVSKEVVLADQRSRNTMDIAEILWRYSTAANSCDLRSHVEDEKVYVMPRIVVSDTELHLILNALEDDTHHCYNLTEVFDVLIAYFSHICYNTVFEAVPSVLAQIIEALVNITCDKDSLDDLQRVIRAEPAQFRELLSCHRSIKLNIDLDLQMLTFLARVMYCAPDIAETIACDHPHVVDRALETLMLFDATELEESEHVTLLISYAVRFYNTFFLAARNEQPIQMMLAPVCKLLLFLLQYPRFILQNASHVVVYTLVSLYLDMMSRYGNLEETTANVMLALLVRNLSDLAHDNFIVAHMIIRSILRIEDAMFWEKSNASHTMYVTFTMRMYKSMIKEFTNTYTGDGMLSQTDSAIAFNKILSLLEDY